MKEKIRIFSYFIVEKGWKTICQLKAYILKFFINIFLEEMYILVFLGDGNYTE